MRWGNRTNKKTADTPSAFSEWMLRLFLMKEERNEKLGDFGEAYAMLLEESGRFRADLWYRNQILLAIPVFLKNITYWRLAMFKNYILIALRNIQKQKMYSFITLSGLALGLAMFIMFALINVHMKTYDHFHENFDRIYSVVQVMPGGQEGDKHSAVVAAPLLPEMMNAFPEIEDGARFRPGGQVIVKRGDQILYENRMRFVDDRFLSIFTFPLVRGDEETALSEPYSIVLTEEMALKYFGDENPVGQSLTLNTDVDVTVTGVLEDVPDNSSIYFDFLVSMETAEAIFHRPADWKRYNQAAFLLLSEDADPAALEGKLDDFLVTHYEAADDSPKEMYLLPLGDFALNSYDIDNYWSSGHASFLALWIISVLILIIAAINFINLSTARYVTRAKEVGLRKVIGAYRLQLIRQFLSETVLYAFLALPLAILLFAVIQPAFNAFMGSDIFEGSLVDHPRLLVLVILVTFLTGLISGLYPAFYLSVFKPVSVLKGETQKGKKGNVFRKILVVVQFVFSILLISMTFISMRQSQFMQRVDLGFTREHILSVDITEKARSSLSVLKEEARRHGDVVAVSAAKANPISWEPEAHVYPEGAGQDESIMMNVYGVDYMFTEMLDIRMLQGRTFSRDFNDEGHFVINELALEQLQWDDPVGKEVTFGDRKGTVIGVAKNFHFKPIFMATLSPAILYLEPTELNQLLVKYSGEEKKEGVVAFLEKQWRFIVPDQPFEYTTLDDFFERVYITGDKTSEMMGVLGGMAIILSCMGLLGLSAFSVERRFKEIGIRKVLGASVSGVVAMLVRGFLKLVVISNVIAIPMAVFFMIQLNRFLYTYPVKIKADIFMFTVLISLVVAFLTVMSQTLKAARSNPVDSLQYE